MKTIMIFLTFISNVLIGACANHQSSTLIENFVDEIVISGKIDKIEEFLDLGEDIKSNPEYLAFFKENFASIKDTMEEGCSLEYELFTFDEARKSNINTIGQYEKNYSKFDHVYFVVCDGKIILPIIQENNKIISIQSSMLKKLGGDYSPFLLNQ
ncbi:MULTISPECIES: hypothetical protein [Flagellimonas]|uniref:Uncharacterized protein n=1 Tax=Flagellimonas hadalis TaxID=2597517 RepID=A0A5N5IX96_9FLAO|nr:hypothetical protein [Allomuricauda hadalis]KAB5491773.1 hypothetical protein FOT42_002135 [Allomuricauda hadalis]RUA18531.1 MAG: hypothetical protein DSY83_02050 [Flavobacteriia bacterium]